MAHIRLVGRCQLAAMQHESALVKELEVLVLNASGRRTIARRSYQDHAAVHISEAAQLNGFRADSTGEDRDGKDEIPDC